MFVKVSRTNLASSFEFSNHTLAQIRAIDFLPSRVFSPVEVKIVLIFVDSLLASKRLGPSTLPTGIYAIKEIRYAALHWRHEYGVPVACRTRDLESRSTDMPREVSLAAVRAGEGTDRNGLIACGAGCHLLVLPC